MSASVDFEHGDVLEGGYDLTVLPCSSKGSVSGSVRRTLRLYGLTPEFPSEWGHLGPVQRIPIERGGGQIVFAASVLNGKSTSEKIQQISSSLGQLTQSNSGIRLVETPLLGTGAGGLPDVASARALTTGFRATAHEQSRLTVFVYGQRRLKSILEDLEGNSLPAPRLVFPARLTASLKRFREYRTADLYGFLSMNFRNSTQIESMREAVQRVRDELNVQVLRADDVRFSDSVLDNVLTHIYGCDFGIALLEPQCALGAGASCDPCPGVHNPNVALEIGGLMSIGKPVLLLKPPGQGPMPVDIHGQLYYECGGEAGYSSLPNLLRSWLLEQGFLVEDGSA